MQTEDSKDLERLGYAQELLRDMGGFSSFAVSFSVISILTGCTQLYGYGLTHGGPIQMSVGWLLVSFFTLLVAMSMSELASAYPTAGALYHWSSFLGGRAFGWFTASFNTIGMFAIVAGIDYGLAQFIANLTGFSSSVVTITLLYTVILFSHALLNHFGIRLVSWLNDFSAWYHIAVVFFILASLFHRGFAQPPHFLLTFKNSDGFSPSYSFLIGLLLSQWTLTGFDASAHVTEETTNPRKNAPWGIFLAVAVSAFFGFILLTAVTLSIENLDNALSFGDGAFIEILKNRLGANLGMASVSLVAGAMWLCGLATMTSASRMVYAFARDGGLPYAKIWAKISARHKTPSHAIWGLAGLALILAFSVNATSAIISIATIALYISYGLPILARLIFRFRKRDEVIGPWNLGSLSTTVAVISLFWILFVTVIFVLPPNGQAGIIISGFTLVICAVWFLHDRKHFRGPKNLEMINPT